MKTLQEIDQEYVNFCAMIGHKQFAIEKLEAEIHEHKGAVVLLEQTRRKVIIEAKEQEKINESLHKQN